VRRALFPGSFDPFTIGHQDLVHRSLSLVDEVLVLVGHNAGKQCVMSVETRVQSIRALYVDEPRVRVESHSGAIADAAEIWQAQCIVKGLRDAQDLAYEMPMAHYNRVLGKELETVFLACKPELQFVTSSAIRQIHKLGRSIDEWVPAQIRPYFWGEFS
jgi:pantetheine-phosphate adenylyltransferase